MAGLCTVLHTNAMQFSMRLLLLGGMCCAVFAACASDRAAAPKNAEAGPTSASQTNDAGTPQEPINGPALLAEAQTALAAGNPALARRLAQSAARDPAVAAPAGLVTAESHLLDDGDLDAAEKAMGPSLQVQPMPRPTGVLLARLREAQGRRDEAQAVLSGLAQGDPKDPWPHERLASLALTDASVAQAGGQPAVAKECFQRAASHFVAARTLSEDSPALAMGEARALEGADDMAGAEKALKRLLTLLPDGGVGHAQLAAFYERHGKKAAAKREREAAGDAAAPHKRKLRPLLPSKR